MEHRSTDPPTQAPNIELNLRRAEKSSQAIAGNNNKQLQFNLEDGTSVYMTEPRPDPVLVPHPLRVLPANSAPLLGRGELLTRVVTQLQKGRLEIVGEDGIGKTTLVSHFLHDASATESDSLVYVNCSGIRAGDAILARLFFDFYDYDIAVVPHPAAVQKYLQRVAGLVVLDHAELAPTELAAVVAAVPHCNFLVASTIRHLTALAGATWIRGLAPEDGATLVANHLGPETLTLDASKLEELSRAWDGHPLRLLRCAELLQQADMPIDELIKAGRAADDVINLEGHLSSTVDPSERRLLVLLATVFPCPLEAEHIASITQVPEAQQLLRELRRKGLIEAHSPRYSLRPGVSRGLVGEVGELKSMASCAQENLARWIQTTATAEQILANCGALLQLQSVASRTNDSPSVIALGRGLDRVLALTGQWTDWGNALYATAAAAASAGDTASEAWAWHQLGVRAFCGEEIDEASAFLNRALKLRRSSGDLNGALTTEHNVRVVNRAAGIAEEAYDSQWSLQEEPVESFSFGDYYADAVGDLISADRSLSGEIEEDLIAEIDEEAMGSI